MKVLNGWSDRKMWRVLSALPIGVVFFDLIYGFVLNVLQGLDLQRAVPDSEGVLAVTPDIAFNSLQIVANGGMAAVVCFGLAVVFLLNRSVRRRQVLEIGVFRMLGLVAVLAFSAPSLWEWANALPLLRLPTRKRACKNAWLNESRQDRKQDRRGNAKVSGFDFAVNLSAALSGRGGSGGGCRQGADEEEYFHLGSQRKW